MKFTLDKKSLETFNKDHLLEIEGFYSDDKLLILNKEIDKLLLDEKKELREEKMLFGRDLFRKSEVLKKALQLPLLGQIIYELISVKPLRLAFDQLLQASNNSFDVERASTFLNHPETLEKGTSINELVLGVMIPLNAKESMLPFSGEPGRVVFFGPEIPIPYDFLKNRLADRYLLMAFSTLHAQYLYNEKDPQNHYLKRLGYIYGDRLKDSIHPIVYR